MHIVYEEMKVREFMKCYVQKNTHLSLPLHGVNEDDALW